MPFSLGEKDFGACKESKTRNYVAPVRKKFDEELKPQLVGALGERFKDFVTTGKHPSPYVARVRSRSRGGYYRGHMWLGMAHKKYSNPRNGVQLQFGIDSGSVFSFGIWFEDNATSAKKEASQKITDKKEKLIELLEALGDDYSIYASTSDEKTAKANEIRDKDLDIWIPLLAGDEYCFQILRVLSKEAAIQMGEAIVREIASTFTELLPLYYFLAGAEMSPPQNVKTETVADTKEDLNGAIIRFKADPRVKLWKDLRLVAYEKFRERFATDKLDKLTKAGFGEFLDGENNKSWSGLQRNKPKIVADMEKLRKTLAYLQREEVSVDQRLFEVLVKKDGDLRINGMGHNLATAILQVSDETDRYGVWNERSETTLRRFGLIPSTLPGGQNEAYIVINKSLNDLKETYGMDLIDIDLFVWWVDKLDGKALLWSVDTEKSPDVIKIHQEHIKTMGATYWGAGFPIKKDEFGFPSELPLPLEGYLYEKGRGRVNFYARIESIESYEKKQPPKEVNLRPQPYVAQLWKTYLKISKLETLARPIDISELHGWKDRTPVKQPPQGYTIIVNPARAITEENRLSSNLDLLFKPLKVSFEDLQFEGLMFEDEKSLKEQIHAALNSGKNIMLVGPPGTGKTEIARSLGKMAKEKGYINDYVLTTATSDWTTFDTMGGYVPSKDGNSLQFRPGQFLRCFKEGNDPVDKWLIIDEINRADIDKAFGQLFTVLSGQDVQLPFVTECASGERSVEVMPSEKFKETRKVEISENEYVVPSPWRLIGTLNTYDKASLYQMSYAFMRRFVFIYVDVPSPDFIHRKWEGYLHEWKIDSSGLEYCLDSVKKIWEAMNKDEGKRPIGPAIIRDLLQSIVGRKKGDQTTQLSTEDQKEILTDSVVSLLLPQFEGLENTESLQQELMKYCAAKIVRRFKEMVGG